MKIVEERYNRYGEKDYDIRYIEWGFDELEEQMRMAESIRRFLPPHANHILDVACGISRYHQVWLQAGIAVTGVDISETFIEFASTYNKGFEHAHYLVSDINQLLVYDAYDAAVWTDPVELSGRPVRNIYQALKPGGMFIYEMWNDNYVKYRTDHKHNDCHTWTCKDGVYRLVRHAYNKATCESEHEEIIFDIPNDTMIRKTGLSAKNVNSHCCVQILEAAGFTRIRFVDYEGRPFHPEDQQVKRYFMIGEKK